MSFFKKPMEFARVPFSRLLKMEVPSLAKDVIKIVEKHSPEELQIKDVFDLLVEQMSLIKQLDALYGVHPITLELKPLRDQLLLHVSAIKIQLKVAKKMKTEAILDAATIVGVAFDTHFKRIRASKNEIIVHEKIDAFLNLISQDSKLSNALGVLNIEHLVEVLQLTQAEVRALIEERKALISQRPKVTTNLTANSVTNALKYLFKQIEVAQLKNLELDYAPLFNELNDTLVMYIKMVSRRDSYNKRKAAERNGEVVEDETTEEDNSTELEKPEVETNQVDITPEVLVASKNESFAPIVEVMSENGQNGELNELLDEKKTAALGSNTMQLSELNSNTSI